MIDYILSDTSSSFIIVPVSKDHPTLDLFCDEAASDVFSSDSNIPKYESDAGFSVLWESDEESSVLSLLESEQLDQTPGKQQSLRQQFYKKTSFRTARDEAINWMLKVHAYYRFSPVTAYLSVNYLDRFLLSHKLPQDKRWPMQLLSVACLALAAKMEETRVPLLLDLQVMEPRFLFKPKTVQRMELLVMASLKWRLRVITPFDFIQFFISKLSCFASLFGDFNHIMSRVSDVIIRTCIVTDFLEYPSSTIAAAAMLWVTDQYIDDQKLGCFHKNISRETVQKCCNLMKQKVPRSEQDVPKKTSLPASPNCMLDHVTTALNN
ncbi:hypothetical protein L6164_019807 [Bauhinia variegata]|uniref:Uncharacterized protein n=1 Tax=Bauhinia variegata TaxID=167791 RepID=A0ACB9MV03_BAUVA|nr:hypothetical protein L6164_019807 [Bauhinia variegata]